MVERVECRDERQTQESQWYVRKRRIQKMLAPSYSLRFTTDDGRSHSRFHDFYLVNSPNITILSNNRTRNRFAQPSLQIIADGIVICSEIIDSRCRLLSTRGPAAIAPYGNPTRVNCGYLGKFFRSAYHNTNQFRESSHCRMPMHLMKVHVIVPVLSPLEFLYAKSILEQIHDSEKYPRPPPNCVRSIKLGNIPRST
jgi:hypothetical protein